MNAFVVNIVTFMTERYLDLDNVDRSEMGLSCTCPLTITDIPMLLMLVLLVLKLLQLVLLGLGSLMFSLLRLDVCAWAA